MFIRQRLPGLGDDLAAGHCLSQLRHHIALTAASQFHLPEVGDDLQPNQVDIQKTVLKRAHNAPIII
jgi:hypothetical protein